MRVKQLYKTYANFILIIEKTITESYYFIEKIFHSERNPSYTAWLSAWPSSFPLNRSFYSLFLDSYTEEGKQNLQLITFFSRDQKWVKCNCPVSEQAVLNKC